MLNKLYCFLFGHKPIFTHISGDDGEPTMYACKTCAQVTVQIGPCRCLTRKCECVSGFLSELNNGAIAHRPPVHPAVSLGDLVNLPPRLVSDNGGNEK